jgi:hypothetical protein
VLAFFGGTIYNRVGIKICLMFGEFGYACLVSAYFTTAHIGDRATGWVVTVGCLKVFSLLWYTISEASYPIISMAATNLATAVDSTGCRDNVLPRRRHERPVFLSILDNIPNG